MDMLERARELAKSGAKDAAREMLSQLRDMLENLRADPFAQQMNQDMQGASRMMRDRENMMREQQELLDRRLERSQQTGQQGEGDGQGGEHRGGSPRQERLCRQTGDMIGERVEATRSETRRAGEEEENTT